MRIWFDSFWGLFDKYDNFFTYILSKKYKLEISPGNADIIFTDSPNFIKPYPCKAVYFSGEPFFYINQCDVAITTFNVDDPRFFRIPLYSLFAFELLKNKYIDKLDSICVKNYSLKTIEEKNNLCAYISQGKGGDCPREDLINYCSNLINIHCAGKHLNNHPLIPGEPGTPRGSFNKIEFLKKYKFCFAIENNDSFNGYTGYTTEKIYEPMVANCIPIYWGNENIKDEFNENSFLNIKDFKSYDELIERIILINENKNLYIDYLIQPYIKENLYLNVDYLVSLFDKIID